MPSFREFTDLANRESVQLLTPILMGVGLINLRPADFERRVSSSPTGNAASYDRRN